MMFRTAAVAALAVALAVPGVAKATDPTPLVFTDQAGDANALNDQNMGVAPGGTATPVSPDAYDIREVTIVTDAAGAAATQLIVSLTLEGAPYGGVYRVLGSIGGCKIWTEQKLHTYSPLDGAFVRTCDDGTTGYTYTRVSSEIDGSTITWTIPIDAFAAKGLGAGAVWEELRADARGNQVVLTAPSVDSAFTDATYTVGS